MSRTATELYKLNTGLKSPLPENLPPSPWRPKTPNTIYRIIVITKTYIFQSRLYLQVFLLYPVKQNTNINSRIEFLSNII